MIIALIILNTGFSQSKTITSAPDIIVKNLYDATKRGHGPFFQNKSKSLLEKYFTREFAALIWNDVVDLKGEVGVIDFDPLYNAQDVHIKNFKIGKPEYGEGNLKVADVPVSFKNMGTPETILFRTEQTGKGIWKISDIYYPRNEKGNSSLKGLLQKFGTKSKK